MEKKTNTKKTSNEKKVKMTEADYDISVVEKIDINKIRPFHDHPFKLYTGDRLDDMVESIKNHGVMTPIIVRKMPIGYELLAGHNRHNAAKLAGLKEIPAIVKENISDQEAYVYVIETNLMQRSFGDLSISEKAAVLEERYNKVLYERDREKVLKELKILDSGKSKGGHDVHLTKNRDEVGCEYGLSGRHIARLMRVNHLTKDLKDALDNGDIQLVAAVQLSYLPEQAQKIAYRTMIEKNITITEGIAKRVRNAKLTQQAIADAVTGENEKKDDYGYEMKNNKIVFRPIKLSAGIREKYFPYNKTEEIEIIVDKALESWFKKKKRK